VSLRADHADAWLVGHARRRDGLGDLCGVARNELAGGTGDPVYGPEGAAQIDAAVYARLAGEASAELAPETAHDMDVGTGSVAQIP
jgi:hypothetical protein